MSIQNINLGALNTNGELTILGQSDTTSGESVSGIGDVNKDGYDDILIGAPRCSSKTTYTTCVADSNFGGISYVIYGGQNIANINLAILTPAQGFYIFGNGTASSGYSVGGAGDVNNDGYSDFIIGAPGANSKAGISYLIFGNQTSSLHNIELINLNSTQGFTIYGANAGDYSGYSVRGAGDVNNDGYSDIIIGAPNANSKAGISYIIFGNRTEYLKDISLSTLAILQGIAIFGASVGDQSGWSAGGAGKVNSDNYADVIIGAPSALGYAGISYVVFGSKTLANINLADLTIDQGFNITGASANDYSGLFVSAAGDFNSDGYNDVIIGAPATNLDSGSSYVVFGGKNAMNLNLANNENGKWITITGAAVVDYSGTEVGAAGDVNGDGIADVVIGAPGAGDAGTGYVVFGSSNPSDLSLADLYNSVTHTSPGFSITGANFGDNLGFSVGGAGDFNNDGYDDIVLGAPGVGYYDNGASYVIYGADMPPKEKGKPLTPGEIAGIVIGCVAFVGVVGVGGYSCYQHGNVLQTFEDVYNILAGN